jgi:pyruvate dehydrogenase E2 component (dihydrolipoamide acetyltransferase)
MAEVKEIQVPDIGDFDAVDVIDVLVSPGDRVSEEDGLITLESEKASMDVPSPMAGTVKEVKVSAGDQVAQGDVIVLLEVEEGAAKEAAPREEAEEPEDAEAPAAEEKAPERAAPSPESPRQETPEAPPKEEKQPRPVDRKVDEAAFARAYASPAVRRFARELGVDLSRVDGSGRKGRIVKEDVQGYVKRRLSRPEATGAAAGPAVELPEIDFSRWGAVETEELGKIQRLTGRNVHRSWVTIPHVTQHDVADVTELEEFRKAHAEEAKERGVKLTPIPFLVKAVVAALKEFPRFNASLSPDGETLVLKRYFHVGIAVDTPQGLVVPVVRDADRKGLFELAGEVVDLASRARDRKLKLEEMEGGCFSISSLGGIGGTGFTPIVNWPEVAILGVSRAEWRPRWNGEGFEPRQMLPLSLSYDHRVIDGAAAVRFTQYLARVLGDLRRLLL